MVNLLLPLSSRLGSVSFFDVKMFYDINCSYSKVGNT